MKRIFLFTAILLLVFALTACGEDGVAEPYDDRDENAPAIFDGGSVRETAPQISRGSVRVLSGGNTFAAYENWHHGFCPEFHASGIHMLPEEAAEMVTPILMGEDFQIVIEGEPHGRGPSFHFHKRIDDRWISVLAVHPGSPYEIFLAHGDPWGGWERIYADSFLDLLGPGEYILDVDVWWGNAEAASAWQKFFWLIKEEPGAEPSAEH